MSTIKLENGLLEKNCFAFKCNNEETTQQKIDASPTFHKITEV